MSELTLISDFSLDTTSLSNIYIDEYMSANNESQIKIYLYLLRNLSKGAPVSVITIADTFNYSVTDVERALLYMEKQGLMGLKMENDSIVGLRLLPLKKKRQDTSLQDTFRLMETKVANSDITAQKAPEKKQFVKPEYSAKELSEFCEREEIEELLFVVQQYIGKPATQQDIKSLMFISTVLMFKEDLIDYLVEQCVENGKKSFRYIEKVALDWAENGVTTVEEAKAFATNVPKEVYEVFSAFSIKAGSRKPTAKEASFVNKWTKEFLFDMSVIGKACEMTLDKTHSVSFEYADAILSDWSKNGLRNISEVKKFLENKKFLSGKTEANTGSTVSKRQTKTPSFSAREYDFEKLEKELLSN